MRVLFERDEKSEDQTNRKSHQTLGAGRKRGENCPGEEKVQEAIEDKVSELVSIWKIIEYMDKARQSSCICKNHNDDYEY